MKHLTPEQMNRRWLALGIVALAYVVAPAKFIFNPPPCAGRQRSG